MLSVRERACGHDTKGLIYMNSPSQGIRLVSLEDVGSMALLINKPRGNDFKNWPDCCVLRHQLSWWQMVAQVQTPTGWHLILPFIIKPINGFVGWKRKLI